MFYAAWELLNLSNWHHKLLLEGLTLNFHSPPPLCIVPRQIKLPLNLTKRLVLLEEVKSLITKKALEKVSSRSPGFYSHLFTVPKRSGGYRPVIDLKALNKYVICPHFHMETDRSIRSQLRPGEWTTSVDLSDAYLHIPVHSNFRKYLRLNIMGQTYQFRAMCFGLNIAPRVFTKLLDPVAASLRAQGILVHRYLDDWLIRAQSPELVLSHTHIVLKLFQQLGLIVNREKSELSPRTRFIFLGMDIDLVHSWIRPTQAQLGKITDHLTSLRGATSAKVRQLLSLIGSLNHASQFIRLGRLHVRPLQFFVKAKVKNLKEEIDSWVPLDQHFHATLVWWTDSQRLTEGVPLHPPEPTLSLLTDASLEGWGAFLEGHRRKGMWSQEETQLHISILELRAVLKSLQALAPLVQGKAIHLMCDNVTAVAYIRNEGGTHSIALYRQTRELLLWCSIHQISLKPFYLPGHLNSVADLLSRSSQVLGTEWTLHTAVFRRIHQMFPEIDVDLFATRLTTQLKKFVSPCPDPQAWAVDAMSMEWTNITPYAFPPFKLIPEVLKKLRQSSIRLFLIAPLWPNQSWFPEILELLCDQPVLIPAWHKLLRQPLGHRFHHNPQMLHLHVWPLSGLVSDRTDFRDQWHGMQPHPRDNLPFDFTNHTGEYFPIGAQNETWIQARPLFTK